MHHIVFMFFVCANENHTFDVWFKRASSGVFGKKTSFGKIEKGLSTKSKPKEEHPNG